MSDTFQMADALDRCAATMRTAARHHDHDTLTNAIMDSGAAWPFALSLDEAAEELQAVVQSLYESLSDDTDDEHDQCHVCGGCDTGHWHDRTDTTAPDYCTCHGA